MTASDVHAPRAAWSFWIDRGGTFTDIVARRPDGTLLTHKLLSDNPEQYADAATAGIRAVLAMHGETLRTATIDEVRMGTTVATNALLERRGEPTLLAITRGFADALRIGDQTRPRLFDLHIRLPAPLYDQVVEIDERVAADGSVVRALDEQAACAALQSAYDRGLRAVAIVLMHAWRHPRHEQRLAQLAREIGYTQISTSHDCGALIKLVGRGNLTVVDAYLTPVLRRYVDRIAAELRDVRLLFMQSNGGLVEAAAFRGKDAILSGPAGGIVGMARTAEAAGFAQVIGFDMGGTSTDVSHYDGAFERRHESRIAGLRLLAPMLDIHTVAAGGGSVCHFDGLRLRVGPQSAGAVPGPACYRRGGPLTITDCNLLLGRLQPAFFPTVFGPHADQPLDRDVVVERFDALAREVRKASGVALSPQALAEGYIRIAVEHMANAIKEISIQRGRDASRYTLACFGGAGGQHACRVAEALGMQRVLIHPFAGVLSALGMGLAEQRVLRERSLGIGLDDEAQLHDALAELRGEATAALQAQHVPQAEIRCVASAHLKYAGTDTSLPVAADTAASMRAAFEAEHRARFGFVDAQRRIVIERVGVEAIRAQTPLASAAAPTEAVAPAHSARVWFDGAEREVPVLRREALRAGTQIDGPAIICEATATTVVEPRWRARVDAMRNLILERIAAPRRDDTGATFDPIRLEVFNKLFMAVAEQMGDALQNTAHSVNIKERMDFSCALFDAQGQLVANAPHIPVHLGSMGDCVRAVIHGRTRERRAFAPGEAWMLNSPYNGGTHLPDVTVVMPVFDRDTRLLGFVAARGHHADIGGMTPGSMPPQSRCIDDEGVLIDDFRLLDGGRLREAEVRALLASGAHPARNPDQNLADLQAQLAACMRGAQALRQLVHQHGRDTVLAYMAHVLDHAEAAVRRLLPRLHDGRYVCTMDNGARIAVAITLDRRRERLCIDFSGSSAQRPDNFNAPLPVCRAAVLYVIRCLLDDDIPLNDGCLRAVDLIVPEGSMLNPRYPAAVAAGNVETSQVIVDTLFAAFGALAGSQGTMNNLTFGDGAQQYYETICGGAGAGADFDGASAVHTHMTNSRLTDAEVLEARYPVRVERFAIRAGSGGRGRRRGGDGVERRIRFLAPMTAAILSNRRRTAAPGLAGGGDGLPGRNRVERADGRVEPLGATAQVEMQAGDVFVIDTPGGGGYGRGDT
ncbi:hydantoinase B/oxoprolinase family protein [Sinimarinibacterium thermocellulolyticum]|uniref:Hydantoinase B/oxoprolinase family protein n=1 Tax=Sinimarinibacterium thermocellulolyticum TaxID=3170016 RepID=A0ABV2A6U6_9GAMM